MAHSKPGTLTPNVATADIQIDDTWPHGITIINITGSGTGIIWYRLDGVNPEPMADDSFVCVDAVFIPNPANGQYTPNREAVKIRLISSAALQYTVEGNPAWKLA